jgi:hypothetical protein
LTLPNLPNSSLSSSGVVCKSTKRVRDAKGGEVGRLIADGKEN